MSPIQSNCWLEGGNLVSLTFFRAFSCRISSWNFEFPVHQLQSTPWRTYRFIWNCMHLLLLPCGTFSNLPPRSFTEKHQPLPSPFPAATSSSSSLTHFMAKIWAGNIRLELWIQWVSIFLVHPCPCPKFFSIWAPVQQPRSSRSVPYPAEVLDFRWLLGISGTGIYTTGCWSRCFIISEEGASGSFRYCHQEVHIRAPLKLLPFSTANGLPNEEGKNGDPLMCHWRLLE